jgi:hypothetical protein
MRKFIAPLLAAALLFSYCSDDAKTTDEDEKETGDIVIPADIMGMVHAGSTTPIAESDVVKAEFDVLDEIGIKWILDDFSWNRIQTEAKKDSPSDEWNWSAFDTFVENAELRGKKVLGILDYDTEWLHGGRKKDGEGNDVKAPFIDYLGVTVQEVVFNDDHLGRCVLGADEIAKFCAYVRATVARYKGRVGAWSIWNEPNLQPRFWTGTKEQFFELSIAAAKAAREVDPDAVILVGAFNSIATDDWINALYNSGATDQANGISYHPYTTNSSGTEANYISFVNKSAAGFRDKMWITEVGHPTGGEYPTKIAESRMPQTIVKTITILAASGAQKIFWYHLDDSVPRSDENNSERHFGLYTRDSSGILTPKGKMPAAYKLAAEHIPGKTLRKDGLPGFEPPVNVKSYYFEGGDGKRVLVVWNSNLYATAEVEINLPGSGHILHDPYDGTSAPAQASATYQLPRSDTTTEKVLFFTW